MGDALDSTGFPQRWLERLAGLPEALTLNVAGHPVTVALCRDDLAGVYLPVLGRLVEHLGDRRRIVAGLAGIPGSGKSTFAGVLALIADTLLGMGRMVAVGMDGWHWPNAVLDSRMTTDEAGKPIPLRRRKGGPESFDIDALAAAVRELHDPTRATALPMYDRRVHDPVPGAIHVGPGTAIVLLEGNFLLDPTPPWKQVSDLLSPRLFLEHDPADARQRVIDRHVRGGLARDAAVGKYDCNDRLNTAAVLATAGHADVRIRF